MKLAIDFGTTNTVIFQWDGQRAKALTLPNFSAPPHPAHPDVVPSLVYVHNGQTGQVTIGQAVRAAGLDERQDNRLFRNFKRALLMDKPPEPRLIDGVPWAERDAGRAFVNHIVRALPCPLQEVEQLILTTPVAAFDSYLNWLQQAVAEFGIEQIHVVDESTAAALGYAVTEAGALILVVDFGGGTLDLSLAQLPKTRGRMGGRVQQIANSAHSHSAKVLAKTGQTLGGSDVDHWLVGETLRRTGLTPADLGLHYAALHTACEEAKIALSSAESAEIVFTLPTGATQRLPLTRAELESLLTAQGFYATLRRTLDKLLRIAQRNGVFKEDVQHVLLVGGTSLMPSVQAALQRYFLQAQVRVDKPFTAVAEGALQIAAGVGVQDRLPSAYGLRYLDPATGQCHYDEIIPLGSPYPSEKAVELVLQAAHPQQIEIEIVIGEIDPQAVQSLQVNYEDGQTVFVAQAASAAGTAVPVHDAQHPPLRLRLNPPGKPKEDRVKITLEVDAQRQLRLNAVDLKTKQILAHASVCAHLRPTASHGNLIAPPTTDSAAHSGREPALGLKTKTQAKGLRRFSLRQLATTLLNLPPSAIAPEAARAALESPDYFVRYNAAENLSRRGDREARLIMEEVLQHADPRLRAVAARHLHRFSWYSAAPLLRTALQDTDHRVRASALYALCNLRELEAYTLMTEALAQREDDLCMAVAWGLGETQDPAAVPVLALAAEAQDPEVRAKALESLGATGSPTALPILQPYLLDADAEVQYSATLSALEVGQLAALPVVAQAIVQTQGKARYPVLRGFFHASNYLHLPLTTSLAFSAILQALQAALSDPLPEVRYQAAYPLAWIRDPQAEALLWLAYAGEPDADTQAKLVHLASDLMSPLAPRILADARQSSRPAVKAVAEQLR